MGGGTQKFSFPSFQKRCRTRFIGPLFVAGEHDAVGLTSGEGYPKGGAHEVNPMWSLQHGEVRRDMGVPPELGFHSTKGRV